MWSPTKHVGSSKIVHGPFFLGFELLIKSQKGQKKRWIPKRSNPWSSVNWYVWGKPIHLDDWRKLWSQVPKGDKDPWNYQEKSPVEIVMGVKGHSNNKEEVCGILKIGVGNATASVKLPSKSQLEFIICSLKKIVASADLPLECLFIWPFSSAFLAFFRAFVSTFSICRRKRTF